MLEAYYERMNPESAGLNNIAVPNRTFNSGNILALTLNSFSLGGSYVVRGPHMGYGRDLAMYVNPATTHPEYDVTTAETHHYWVSDFLTNYSFDLPEWKAPYYSMTPGFGSIRTARLLSDFIRAKFWTFNKMSKLLIGLRLGDVATKLTYQILNEDGSISDEFD